MLEAMKKSKFAVAVDSIGPKAKSSSTGVVIAGRSEQFGPVPTTAASTKEKKNYDFLSNLHHHSYQSALEADPDPKKKKNAFQVTFPTLTMKHQHVLTQPWFGIHFLREQSVNLLIFDQC